MSASLPEARCAIQTAELVPSRCSCLSHAMRSFSPAGPDVFTSVSHAPSERPVFSLRLSRQFVTNATLGCTL